jgi:hypothetical protein
LAASIFLQIEIIPKHIVYGQRYNIIEIKDSEEATKEEEEADVD